MFSLLNLVVNRFPPQKELGLQVEAWQRLQRQELRFRVDPVISADLREVWNQSTACDDCNV